MERPSFRETLRFWLKLGFVSFGGPTGQIALMHEELVERRRWIGERRFLHALNFCMLLPGPEAQQLATYVGWLLHGRRGGLAAGALFVLPSVVVLWTLSWVYVRWGQLPWADAALSGLQPAVVAIVAHAVLRIGRRALRTPAAWILAAAAFVGLRLLDVPFPLIILGAGVLGLIVGARARWLPPVSVVSHSAVLDDEEDPDAARLPDRGDRIRLLVAGLALWWLPVAVAGSTRGWDSTLAREGVFFSQVALVTFGGAYAVLPYVAQKAVEDYGWLSAGQMLDGLGLAETTPGPLVMVLQFVGFLAGWNHPDGLSPLVAATLGALLTTWVTFVPCFLFIFLGAPHVERLRGNQRLRTALAAITAAVVGVVLNLAVWFGAHVLVPAGALDLFALAVAAAAFVALAGLRWSVVAVVALGAAAGLLRHAAAVL